MEDARTHGLPVAVPVGMTAGFTAAAMLLLGYGWLHRIPTMAFEGRHSAIFTMLWHTTAVVMVSVVLVVVTWSLHPARRSGRFRVWVVLGLVILAIVTLGYLRSGSPRKAFAEAYWQQTGLDAVQSTTVATVAWWCACLALLSLALVWSAGQVNDGNAVGRHVIPVALLVVVIIGGVVEVTVIRTRTASTTAGRIDPALPTRIAGEVAYRIDVPHTVNRSVFPGGAGFLRVPGNTFDTEIEGFDGGAGQSRWVFHLPGRGWLRAVAVTGFGPDSVAVLNASYVGTSTLIGIDATTGVVLWVSNTELEQKFQVGPLDTPQLSNQVVFVGHKTSIYSDGKHPSDVEWNALSPRTGAVMWSTTVPGDCDTQPKVARDVVILARCNGGPDGDEIAFLLDPATGERRGEITASQLGVDRRAAGLDRPVWVFPHPDSTFMPVHFPGSDPHGPQVGRVIDLTTGRLAYSLPDGSSAAVIPPDWLRLAAHLTSETLVDLQSGKTITTDRVDTRTQLGVGRQWAQVGAEVATLLPALADPGDGHAPLTLVNSDGATRTLPNPCADQGWRDVAPSVTTIPGALLVDCGAELVGMR